LGVCTYCLVAVDYISTSTIRSQPGPERKLLYIPGIGSGSRGLSNLLVQLFGAAAGTYDLKEMYGNKTLKSNRLRTVHSEDGRRSVRIHSQLLQAWR
jgi:hypothetical protein